MNTCDDLRVYSESSVIGHACHVLNNHQYGSESPGARVEAGTHETQDMREGDTRAQGRQYKYTGVSAGFNGQMRFIYLDTAF